MWELQFLFKEKGSATLTFPRPQDAKDKIKGVFSSGLLMYQQGKFTYWYPASEIRYIQMRQV